MSRGFVLVPGAGMSEWAFTKLIPMLSLRAATVSQRLASNTADNRLNAAFEDVLAQAEAVVNQSGFEEVILVGHSGAGLIVGSLAKRCAKISHVVFVAANIPRHGTTAIEVFSPEIQAKNLEAMHRQAQSDRIPMKQLEQQFRGLFCNTCTEEDIAAILRQDYLPEPLCVFTEKMDWSDYPAIDKTYIICTQDKTLTERQQEYLAANLNITDMRRIASDHMVMVSHPEELAAELNQIAASR